MHFSIPDTQECIEQNGSTFIGYNINVNGEFHCTLRYKQLHNLNEQLKKYHGADSVPVFPPKKYWPLTPNQVEDRRSLLEKYIQTLGQNRIIVNSEPFNKFLLNSQQECSGEKVQEVNIEVFLMNGFKISLEVNSNESSSSVLEKVCNQINLPLTYMYYFSLFLIRKEDGGDITILRKLHDFESPYISHKSIQGSHKIMLRKSYWDINYDFELMSNRSSLNLLYIQTVQEVERGWVVCPKEVHTRLAALQATGSKRQYMEEARSLNYYGYIQFNGCRCSYPEERRVIVSVGGWELRVRPPAGVTGESQAFRVTRMRAWRITTHRGERKELELSFEYLIERDKLEWITISSQQSILMSVCLQGMVDDLLLKKSGLTLKQVGSSAWLKKEAMSQSSSAETICSSNGSGGLVGSVSMRKLSERLNSRSSQENDAFEGIGDDDL